MKEDFYRLKNIHNACPDAAYYVIFGPRSNGKSYAVHEYAIDRYYNHGGEQLALLRRWSDDFKGNRGQQMFANQASTGNIRRITKGEWTDTYYYRSAWYLCRYTDEGERITDETPFAFAFAVSSMEHDKSVAYPHITTVLFDEFIAKSGYITDEFVLFQNALKTIIRERTNVRIYMLANTINRYCPYFKEMGLSHAKDMKPDTIDVYTFGESKLKVAVEYSDAMKSESNDRYFAFDNPKLQMISGVGWEIDIYPHLPRKYKPKDVMLTYFIEYDDELMQCEIIVVDGQRFTFVHPKTTPLKDPDKDIIYSTKYDPRPNWARKITKPSTPWQKKIALDWLTDKVFYSDNSIGDLCRNYLEFCRKYDT